MWDSGPGLPILLSGTHGFILLTFCLLMNSISFGGGLLPGRTLGLSQLFISPLLGRFPRRSSNVLSKDTQAQRASNYHQHDTAQRRMDATYLFAFFSIMSVTEMFDFQIGSTKSWVRLSG